MPNPLDPDNATAFREITSDQSTILAREYRQYLPALLNGDRRACQSALNTIQANHIPIRRIYEDLFQQSLYTVGELWERGRISVATEHLATAITESLMVSLYPHLFEKPHINRSAVVSCTANEYHQIGGKMVADTFELHGWSGYFLGANTPLADLLTFIDARKPDVIALSLTVYFNLEHLLKTASTLRSTFPDTPIWVGGQAFRWGGLDQVSAIPNLSLVLSLPRMEEQIAQWGA